MQEQPISLLEWCEFNVNRIFLSFQFNSISYGFGNYWYIVVIVVVFFLSLVSVIISGILGTLFNATLADAVCNEEEDFPHDTGAQIVM